MIGDDAERGAENLALVEKVDTSPADIGDGVREIQLAVVLEPPQLFCVEDTGEKAPQLFLGCGESCKRSTMALGGLIEDNGF